MRQAFLLLLSLCCAASARWIAAPEGGVPMLTGSVALRAAASNASVEQVAVEGMPFDRAARVTVNGATPQAWDVQLTAATTGDLQSGDVVWLSFFVRGSGPNESGEGSGTAYVQKRGAPNDKLVSAQFAAGSAWRQYMTPARVTMSLASGQHEITIFLGYGKQTVEVGGLALLNFGRDRNPADLPVTRLRLPFMDADAPWRKEAAERIDRIRKTDIRVAVRDAAGLPVENAEVRVVQKRHEFGFGSAVAADALAQSGPDGDRYRAVVRDWFNKAVLENDLKWPSWEANRARALGALEWLRNNGISKVRGHTLVWPGWSRMPKDVETLRDKPEALRERVLKHIEEELSATRGQLVEWDVLNEPYTNKDLQAILGDAEMAAWFKKAREAEPAAVLYINDYSILTNNGTDKRHQDHYFTTIGDLIEQGADVAGIGMQGHFGAQLTPPARLWEILDRFAVFGKRIQVTEFDIDIGDEEAQALYTRDFLTAVFAHPSIDGFMMWGFWEGRHWRPRAAMFRKDWTLKPNAFAYYDLVFNQWWTDVTGRTDAAGGFAARGFKGDYEVTVSAGGKTAVERFHASGEGSAVTVTLR